MRRAVTRQILDIQNPSAHNLLEWKITYATPIPKIAETATFLEVGI